MRAKWLAVVYVIGLLVSGCAGGMIPGQMTDLTDGGNLQFAIQKSRGQGTMTAYNPKTKERFSGDYTGFYTDGGVAFTNVDFSNGATPKATTFAPPIGANARGVLVGNKGTVMQVYLDIKPGLIPHGAGEGVDNNGKRYHVRF